VKQLVVLSGKGGTGKTSLSAAFAHLSNHVVQFSRAVFVDADVDAANLSLVLQPELSPANEFWGGSLAEIVSDECVGCEDCQAVCRFNAVAQDTQHAWAYRIDPLACDGCAACVYACPQGSIHMTPQQEGHWYHATTPYGALFHAELFPGRENSGKLVTLVKQRARLWAEETDSSLVIIDGPPGIGCPVISACAGADLGLIVTEPSLAGLHDMQRALGVLQHFRVPAAVCINKADIFPQGIKQIRDFAEEQTVEVLGEIPFDEHIPEAMFMGIPISMGFPDSPAAQSIQKIWGKILERLFPVKG